MNERYFIVFFSGNGFDGHMEVKNPDGRYPTKTYCYSVIKEREKIDWRLIRVTNIIELTKEDFESWNS